MTGVAAQTAEDLSSTAHGEGAAPAIVMVASAHRTAARALAPPATLGRRCAGAAGGFELDDERVSKEHAAIAWERGAWQITDLASRNGTFVDGERLPADQRSVRRAGDVVVRVGHTVFVLLADGRGHPAEVPAGDAAIVGPELARAYDQIRAHAGGDSLLVHGESGAGKELAARLYHEAGPRRGGPFVAVNCAAIPEGVAERLLFGSRRGAYSGAVDAIGHLAAAAGGTLFLDEIADLEAAVQAKLLRVLETREVVPVGATAGTRIDLGVVAASHRELRAAVAERRFRDDLYYRIARATIHLPPLRERKVDGVRLVERELRAIDPGLAAHAKLVEACAVRPWPGNVRELVAAIRQAAVAARLAGRTLVRVEDLPPGAGLAIVRREAPAAPPPGDEAAIAATGVPAHLDRETIVAALARANHVVSVAARALGLHRTQLYRLMEKHGVTRPPET